MININELTMLKTREDITIWLSHLGIDKYHIHDDLTVDVHEIVDLNSENLTIIPVQFGVVNADFYCHSNQLTSLKGCPQVVLGKFFCQDNPLANLEYLPTHIADDFYCSGKINLTDFINIALLGNFNHQCFKSDEKIEQFSQTYRLRNIYKSYESYYYTQINHYEFKDLMTIIQEKQALEKKLNSSEIFKKNINQKI